MSEVKLLHNSRCSKSREAFNFLQEKNIKFEVIEYLKKPLSLADIKELSIKLNLKASEFTRKKEAVYKENNLVDASDEGLMKAMEKFPVLIERPILIVGKKAVIGRPLENIKELLK